MNEFKFSEINIGHNEEFTIDIDENKQTMFRELSGDINPLHSDRNFAQSRGFKDMVTFGMLTASHYSTLVGVFLPGKYCLFHECNIKFTKPVYVGDCLVVSGTVVSKNEVYQLLNIKASIKNQNNEVVSKATLKVGVLDA